MISGVCVNTGGGAAQRDIGVHLHGGQPAAAGRQLQLPGGDADRGEGGARSTSGGLAYFLGIG